MLETQHLRAPSVQKTLEILKPCRDIQEFILVRNPIPAPSVKSRFPGLISSSITSTLVSAMYIDRKDDPVMNSGLNPNICSCH
jgi:hypothetical protein